LRLGGLLAELAVQEGQPVPAGERLAALERTELHLAVRAASSALAAQQARLAQAQATPMPVDVAAAKAQLEAAQAALHALESAPQPRDLEEARLQVEVAKNTLYATQLQGEIPGTPIHMQQAARAQAAAAEQTLHIVELQYERVKAGALRETLATARAAVEAAQATLQRLQRGAGAEELAALRAAVDGAQVAVEQAQYQLAQATLTAPFAGTVAQVLARAGEIVAPSTPILTLADLSSLRVETTDLDQTDLARVRVGQTVDLTFDALPNEVLHGRVARIADVALASQGGTSFGLFIQLDQPDARLRWGMTAFVDIYVE
jgi:HlyD family secretion protein